MSAQRTFPIRIVTLAFALMLLPPLVSPAQAKDIRADTRAVLVSGPLPAAGIPWFPPNALPAITGRYRLGKETIGVFFTREILYFTPEWLANSYDDLKVRERVMPLPGAGERMVAAWRDEKGFIILLDFPRESDWKAAFIRIFRTRFSFFLQSIKSDDELSFPAILDLPAK
jgi:hypothetical protein